MRAQLTTELRSLLRQADYDSFDFGRATAYLKDIAKALDHRV
jgi:hypothetical protein